MILSKFPSLSLITFFACSLGVLGISCGYGLAFQSPLPSKLRTQDQQQRLDLPSCYSTTTELSAKRKRRRRKDSTTTTTTTTTATTTSPTDSEVDDIDAATYDGSSISDLPDFDLTDDPDQPSSSSVSSKGVKKPGMATSVGSSTGGSSGNLDEITPAMMSTKAASSGPTSMSVDDLISDRSLEQQFQFDTSEVDTSIPDFAELAARSPSSSSSSSSSPLGDGISETAAGVPQPMGKKKQRQAERRANAIRAREEAEAAEAEANNGLFNIPFFSPDKEKVSGIKILENGAWVGIGLLIAWELYLNSPFFDRAAPMAPVVFEDIFL